MDLNNIQDYWLDRFKQLEKSSYNYGQDIYRKIENGLKDAEIQIQKEIDAWYGRFADNNGITINEAKRLLNSKELDELKWDVNKYIEIGRENAINQKWLKELENASSKLHINRLDAIKLRIQQIAEIAYGNQLDLLDDMAKNIFKENYYHTIFEIQKGIGVGFDIGELDENYVMKIIKKPWAIDGINFSSRIWENKNKLISELHTELTRTVLLGETPKRLINKLHKQFDVSKNNASRLVMTELAFFHTQSQKDAFKELECEEYEISAVLDSKTSYICQEFDGKVFKVKDMQSGLNAPPLHPHCRSIVIPYYDDYGKGTRIAGDGKDKYHIPSNIKYNDWKKEFVKPAIKSEGVKQIKEIFQVKTVEEAKDVLVSRVGFRKVEDSFDRIDDQLIIENTNQLIRLEEKFGMIHESHSTICSLNNGSAIAYVNSHSTNPAHQNLSLCPAYYSNRDEFIRNELELRDKNYSMPFLDNEASIYTVTHEYGHILQGVLIKRRMESKGWTADKRYSFLDMTKKTKKAMYKWYNDIHKEVELECLYEIKEIAREIDPDFRIREHLSKYGFTNYAEFFAEVFANSQLGKPNILGKAMQIWLERKKLIK